MLSKPLPEFSSRLNAWATLVASQWLMGPSAINDVEVGILSECLSERLRTFIICSPITVVVYLDTRGNWGDGREDLAMILQESDGN